MKSVAISSGWWAENGDADEITKLTERGARYCQLFLISFLVSHHHQPGTEEQRIEKHDDATDSRATHPQFPERKLLQQRWNSMESFVILCNEMKLTEERISSSQYSPSSSSISIEDSFSHRSALYTKRSQRHQANPTRGLINKRRKVIH